MVHIAGKRYENRPERTTTVKVYTNLPVVTLYANGKKVATQGCRCGGQHTGAKNCKCGSGKVLTFYVKLDPTTKLEAVAGDLRDTAVLHRTQKADPSYKLNKKTAGGGNWT